MKRGIAMLLRNALTLALAGLSGVVLYLAAGNLANVASAVEKPAAHGPARAADSDPDSLVERSKRAITETGISNSYFDKHFKLIKTVDDPADRRVEWLFSVNGYEAQLVDAIGFHTTGGKRTYVHGIKNQLYATHEIVKTLSVQQARRILRRCIGKYESESVIYRTMTVPGKARLYLTGRSILERERERERGREQKPKQTEGEDEGHFLYVGFVDVETGKCVKRLGRGSS
ncbi:MAG: hypothetical protein AABO41_06025 [Acidobacteriota bacterium]